MHFFSAVLIILLATSLGIATASFAQIMSADEIEQQLQSMNQKLDDAQAARDGVFEKGELKSSDLISSVRSEAVTGEGTMQDSANRDSQILDSLSEDQGSEEER